MNCLSFEEIEIGAQCSFIVKITSEMMESFFHITGDANPLHMRDDFAIKRGFKSRVVYGMLTASFMSTVAGMYLPGEKSLIHSMEGKFLKPVYVGDTLEICGEVIEKSDVFHLIELKIVGFNDESIKVYKGKLKVGVMDE